MSKRSETSKSLAEALGQFVIEFSLIEAFLDIVLMDLIWWPNGGTVVDEQVATALLADLEYSRKVRILRSIAEVRVPDGVKELEGIVGPLSNLGTVRNRLLHSTWLDANREEGGIGLVTKLVRSEAHRIARREAGVQTIDTIDSERAKAKEVGSSLIGWGKKHIGPNAFDIDVHIEVDKARSAI